MYIFISPTSISPTIPVTDDLIHLNELLEILSFALTKHSGNGEKKNYLCRQKKKEFSHPNSEEKNWRRCKGEFSQYICIYNLFFTFNFVPLIPLKETLSMENCFAAQNHSRQSIDSNHPPKVFIKQIFLKQRQRITWKIVSVGDWEVMDEISSFSPFAFA